MFVLLCLCCITQFNRFLGLGLRVLSLYFFVLHFGSTFCVFQSSGHIVCYIVSLGLIILIIILIIMIIPVSCNVIFSDCLVHRFINSFLYSYSVLPVMFLFLVCLCVRLVLALVSVIVISCFIVIVSHPVCIMSSFVSLVRFCQLCSPGVSTLPSSPLMYLNCLFPSAPCCILPHSMSSLLV